MKTVLTLKYSSFLFHNKLSLVKNTPVEVDTKDFTEKDIRVLNTYITSGGIHSSNGLVPVEQKEIEEVEDTKVIEIVAEKEPEQEQPQPEEVKVEEEVPVTRDPLDVLNAPAEETKKAPVKKAPAKKATAK